jgi:disulfide bond formation protein DsbB
MLRELRDWLRGCGFGPVEVGVFVLINLALIAFLVIAYLVDRFHDPALHVWGQRLLSRPRGLAMTAVLPIGGLALLAGLWLGRKHSFRGMLVSACIAVLAAGAFITIGAIDYESKASRRLVPGKRFKPSERYVARRFGVRLPADWNAQSVAAATAAAATPVAAPRVREISTTHGREIFLRICATCHGPRGEGVIGSGKGLRDNAFVNARDEAKLVEFLKIGRQPWEPDNTTKVQMPPRGGDPRLTDDDLRDVAAYLRELSGGKKPGASTPAGDAPDQAPATTQPAAAEAPDEPPPFVAHRSFLSDAPSGPSGLAASYVSGLLRPVWEIPDNAAGYFRLFFLLSGVGALYVVLAGLGVAAALVASLRRRATPALSELLLATVGWWWATGCWTVFFCLLYAGR